MTIVVLASLTLPYKHEETRKIIGWYEYQTAENVRRYVPLYEESDRARAKNFLKHEWGIEV